MGRRISHQAEVERRHLEHGTWSPEGYTNNEPYKFDMESAARNHSKPIVDSFKEKAMAREVDKLRERNPELSILDAIKAVLNAQ